MNRGPWLLTEWQDRETVHMGAMGRRWRRDIDAHQEETTECVRIEQGWRYTDHLVLMPGLGKYGADDGWGVRQAFSTVTVWPQPPESWSCGDIPTDAPVAEFEGPPLVVGHPTYQTTLDGIHARAQAPLGVPVNPE